jgi:hypothetical protein
MSMCFRPLLVGICFAAIALTATPSALGGEARSHDEIAGNPALQANAEDLEHTIVTPHLEHGIPAKTNVLWCGTFQLAWNELCDLSGEPVELEPASTMAEVLNRQTTTRQDLDKSSYVAKAGLANRGTFEKIQKELNAKFNGQASPNLLPILGSTPRDVFITYAYLFKELPFRWKFRRFHDNLEFEEKEVDSFGIRHYSSGSRNDARMASQVAVIDYIDSDDFIVELKTRSKEDRLLLAKVVPQSTLADTIAAVKDRVDSAEPAPMQDGTDLMIPILNFDIQQQYSELEGRRISSSSRKLDGKELFVAAQSIRFRLDERGAVLKSEAAGGGGFGGMPNKNLVFDKPFLILLQRNRAENPYFAMWVGNAELLVSEKVD